MVMAATIEIPMTKYFGSGSSNEPNASRPAHTMNTPMRVTCPTHSGDRVETHARDGDRFVDALLLEEPDVQCHAPDPGWCQFAGERRPDGGRQQWALRQAGRGTAPERLIAAPT